ncbi:hypothetical protein [Cytobacillus praedii]|uniref:hypothetical protein n=1 Tax=Cytobacillus praedii TaxID=1742358 RepID=UPI002E24AE0A|nr:hypothetical protein [Cytobacillus praedii]
MANNWIFVGVKDIFVDQMLDDEELVDEVLHESDDQELANTIMKNKWVYLAVMTLLGGYSLYLELRLFVSNIKDKFNKSE